MVDAPKLNLVEVVNRLLDIGRVLDSGPLVGGIGKCCSQRGDRPENHSGSGNKMTPRHSAQHLVQAVDIAGQRPIGSTGCDLQPEHQRRCLLHPALQRNQLSIELRNITVATTSKSGEISLRGYEFQERQVSIVLELRNRIDRKTLTTGDRTFRVGVSRASHRRQDQLRTTVKGMHNEPQRRNCRWVPELMDQELDQLITQNFVFRTPQTGVDAIDRGLFIEVDTADLSQVFPCRCQPTVLQLV